MVKLEKLVGKEVMFISRSRYFAIIGEHEIIMFPNDELPVQIKRFSDADKVTTLEKNWINNVKLYQEIDNSIFDEYLEKRGYDKEFIDKLRNQ